LTGPITRTPPWSTVLSGAGQLAVAAAFRQEIDDHGARLHPLDRGARNDPGRRAARHARGRDDAVRRRDARIQHFLLLRFLFGGELARVAPRAFRGDASLDELRAERLHLLARRTPDVVGLDHGAEPLRGRDGLQAGDARADDEHRRRADRAGRGRQHREELVERGGAEQHGLVASDGGLRGQRVHRLCARDAGHQLHREARDLPVLQRAHERRLVVRRQEARDDGAGLQARDHARVRRLHGEQEVRGGNDRVSPVGEGGILVLGIGEARRGAGAALEEDPGALAGELGGHLGHDCDAVLASHGLFQHADRDWHPNFPWSVAGRAAARWKIS
jgi:hypothetical protein